MYLAFDPKYSLRKGERNILFYRANYETGNLEDLRLLHPNTAIVLSLFNGRRGIEEIKSIISQLFEISPEEKREYFKNFLETWSPFLCEVTDANKHLIKQYDQKEFIIDASQVDLTHFRLTAPITLAYLPTYSCSRNCIYCYAEKEFSPFQAEMPFEKIKAIINEMRKLRVIMLSLGGGDAFTREDFLDILQVVISANITPIVSTKEYLSEPTVRRLREIGLKTIQLSVDSPVPEIADFLTGSKEYFSQIIKTMDRLLKNNIKVTTNTVVTSYNFHELPKLILFLIEKGIASIHLSQYARSLYRHRDDLFLYRKDTNWLASEVNHIQNKYPHCNIEFAGVSRELEDPEEELRKHLTRPPCPAGKSSFVILPDGKVILCEQLPSVSEFVVGDLNRQSIQEVWDSSALKKLIYPSKELFEDAGCSSCDEFEHCVLRLGRCIRETFKAYGNIYSVDPNCPKASAPLRLS